MTDWNIALVREQGINFAVASVKDHVVHNTHTADELIQSLSYHLGQPVVLLGERQHRLYGRQGIVRFLRNVHPSRLPWKRVALAA